MPSRDDDRIIDALKELTHQVSRVAWALEVERIGGMPNNTFAKDPCERCGSQLVPYEGDTCPSCLEPQEQNPDAS